VSLANNNPIYICPTSLNKKLYKNYLKKNNNVLDLILYQACYYIITKVIDI